MIAVGRVCACLLLIFQWATLRSKKNAEKKLAVTIFSFPPDKGNVGTAAYLDVFGSIHTVLTKLQKEVKTRNAQPETKTTVEL